MKVVGRALVLVLLGLAPAGESAAAGPASGTSSSPTFEQLVETGNRARAGKRWGEAVVAYSDALKLRDDLTVVGRLGVVLLELGEHAAAASQLHRALEEPDAGASPVERGQFVTAYDAARREVCRLDVTLDRTGARVELDGRVVQEGPADFWLFVGAGKHELRARLEGFEEETKEIEAARGGRMAVAFAMRPKVAAQVEARVELAPPQPAPREAPAREEPAPRSVPTNSRGRVALGAGVALVLGATPGAAVGPQIFGAWRRGWFSVGVEGRAAWGLAELEALPDMRFVSWTAAVSPCAHWRVLFGCVLVQVDWLAQDVFASNVFAPISAGGQVGFGLRGGVELFPRMPVHLRIWGDAIARPSGVPVRVDEQPLWTSSAVVASFGAGGVMTF